MLPYDKKSLDAMAGPAREMFEQWISFFPTAPLFGVKWRFAPDGKGLDAGLKMFSPEAMMNALAPRAPADKPVVKTEVRTTAAKPAASEPPVAAAKTVKTTPVAEEPAKTVAKAAVKPAAKAVKAPAAKAAATKSAPVKAAAKTKTVKAPAKSDVAQKAAPKPAARKAPAAKAPAKAKAEGGPVDQIKGIGPRLAAELNEMGITSVGQIAAMSKSDMAKVDEKLTTIKGRCYRDDWIGQAKALMAG